MNASNQVTKEMSPEYEEMLRKCIESACPIIDAMLQNMDNQNRRYNELSHLSELIGKQQFPQAFEYAVNISGGPAQGNGDI